MAPTARPPPYLPPFLPLRSVSGASSLHCAPSWKGQWWARNAQRLLRRGLNGHILPGYCPPDPPGSLWIHPDLATAHAAAYRQLPAIYTRIALLGSQASAPQALLGSSWLLWELRPLQPICLACTCEHGDKWRGNGDTNLATPPKSRSSGCFPATQCTEAGGSTRS